MEQLLEQIFELISDNFEIVWIVFLIIIPLISSFFKKKNVIGESDQIEQLKSKRSKAPIKDSINTEEYFYNNKKIG